MVKTVFAMLFFTTLSLGCGVWSEVWPREVYIQSAWSEQETEIIIRAITKWNETLSASTGEPVMIYKGRHEDASFDVDDMGDGRLAVYKIDAPQKETEIIETAGEVWGVALSAEGYGDILILTFKIKEYYFYPDQDPSGLPEYAEMILYCLAMHELGHVIGFPHSDDLASAMSTSESPTDCAIVPSEIEMFCQVHDCPRR